MSLLVIFVAYFLLPVAFSHPRAAELGESGSVQIVSGHQQNLHSNNTEQGDGTGDSHNDITNDYHDYDSDNDETHDSHSEITPPQNVSHDLHNDIVHSQKRTHDSHNDTSPSQNGSQNSQNDTVHSQNRTHDSQNDIAPFQNDSHDSLCNNTSDSQTAAHGSHNHYSNITHDIAHGSPSNATHSFRYNFTNDPPSNNSHGVTLGHTHKDGHSSSHVIGDNNDNFNDVHNDTQIDDSTHSVHNESNNDNRTYIHNTRAHNRRVTDIQAHTYTVSHDATGNEIRNNSQVAVRNDTVTDIRNDTQVAIRNNTHVTDIHNDSSTDVLKETLPDARNVTQLDAHNGSRSDVHDGTQEVLNSEPTVLQVTRESTWVAQSVTSLPTEQVGPHQTQPTNQSTNDIREQQQKQLTQLFMNNTVQPVHDLHYNGSTINLLDLEDAVDAWKISLGILLPFSLLLSALVGVYLFYRKKYPVRMIIGRDFSKFSNPHYARPTDVPALIRDDAEAYFSNRDSTIECTEEMNPVNVNVTYDNLGFTRDIGDDDNVDDEDEKERNFREKKNWLFRKILHEQEDAPGNLKRSNDQSRVSLKNQTKGTSEQHVRKKERTRSKDFRKKDPPEHKPAKKKSGVWKKQQLHRMANTSFSFYGGYVKETDIDSRDDETTDSRINENDSGVNVLSYKKDGSMSGSDSDASRSSKILSSDNTPQADDSEATTTNKSSSYVKATAILFEQPTFEEVWAMVKAKSRSLSTDCSPAELPPRFFNVNPAKSARKMSLQVDSILSPHSRSSIITGTHSSGDISKDDSDIFTRQRVSPLMDEKSEKTTDSDTKQIKTRRLSPNSINSSLDPVVDVDERGDGRTSKNPMTVKEDDGTDVVENETVEDQHVKAIVAADPTHKHQNHDTDIHPPDDGSLSSSVTPTKSDHSPVDTGATKSSTKRKEMVGGLSTTDTHVDNKTKELAKTIVSSPELSVVGSLSNDSMATSGVARDLIEENGDSHLPHLTLSDASAIKSREGLLENQNLISSGTSSENDQINYRDSTLPVELSVCTDSRDNINGNPQSNIMLRISNNSPVDLQTLPPTSGHFSSATTNSSISVHRKDVFAASRIEQAHCLQEAESALESTSNQNEVSVDDDSGSNVADQQHQALTGLCSNSDINARELNTDFPNDSDDDDNDNGLKLKLSDISEVLDRGSDEDDNGEKDRNVEDKGFV